MVVAASAPARKQNLSGTVIIPREIADLPYFAKEKRVFSRQDALAWIATHVRYVDNCTLKRWQETWSLRYLADAWGWTVKRVRCFLEKLEKWGIIGTTLGKVRGTAQIVITYLVQRLDWSSESNGAQQGHSKGTARAQSKERQEGKEEDSISPQASRPQGPDPMFLPDDDEPKRAEPAGAGPSEEAPGAGQSEASESGSAASNDAGLPKNSAQKGSAQRKALPRRDWRPSEKLICWAMEPRDWDEIAATREIIEAEVLRWIDYCYSNGKRYIDYEATFKNWLRRWRQGQNRAAPKAEWIRKKEAAEQTARQQAEILEGMFESCPS